MAAPFATMQLADLGAEVIKVENPVGGDLVRQAGPFLGTESSPFVRLNRNKRSGRYASSAHRCACPTPRSSGVPRDRFSAPTPPARCYAPPAGGKQEIADLLAAGGARAEDAQRV
jgi:hypothetical protein